MLNVTRRSMLWFLAVALACGAIAIQLRRLPADDTLAQASAKQISKPAAAKVAPRLATSYSLTEDDNDERIRQALKKLAKFDFEEKALRDVLEEVSKQHNIPIWIDDKALADAVIATDTPITRKLQNVSLESALRLMLRPLQLTIHVDQEVLQITTQTEADQRLAIRVYPIGDLLTLLNGPNERREAYREQLVEMITTTVDPQVWDEVGGPCSLQSIGDVLIVDATSEVHQQVEYLMIAARTLRAAQSKEIGGKPVDLEHSKETAAVRDAMEKRIDWEFNEISLRDVVDYISKQSGLEIQLDDKALSDSVIATDTPITLRLRDVRMKNALRLLLHPLQLTFVIRDEVVLITTQAEADQNLLIRLYPVGDLLACESGSKDVDPRWDFDSLIDAIQFTVLPNTWDGVGGPASITAYEGALALVVSQTEEAHNQLEPLLARLRAVQMADRASGSAQQSPTTRSSLVLSVYARSHLRPSQASDQGQQNAARDANHAETPAAGVPSEPAAKLIRELIEPASWGEPGVVVRAVPDRLVIRQTKSAHRQIIELLRQLGSWHEVPKRDLVIGGTPSAFQVADPFEEPARKQGGAEDPFGPAAGQPAEAPSQKRRQGGLPRAAAVEDGQGRKGGAGDAASAERPKRSGSFVTYRMSPAEERIREALGTDTDLEFNEVALRDAIDFIKDKHRIEIQLDDGLLADAAVATDRPITINVKGISLRSALRLMLARLPNNPTFVIGDEVLLITTREGAAQRKLVRIYNVGELIEMRRGPEADPFGAPAPPPRGGYGVAGPRAPVPADHLTELVNVIQQTVEPGTWTPDHGCAVVPLLSKDASLLVVRQSALAHEEIVELLKSIQDAQREQR